MNSLDPSDSLAKRWGSMDGKHLILLSVMVGMIGGLGGGVGGSMFRVDPFTGSDGAVHESRIATLEREHVEFRKELAALPPDWFEEDFRQLRDQLNRVHQSNDELKIELIKISHQLGALQMRGHFSPNDLVSPGLFKKGKEK